MPDLLEITLKQLKFLCWLACVVVSLAFRAEQNPLPVLLVTQFPEKMQNRTPMLSAVAPRIKT